jgi:hypothetical protein
VSFVVIDFQFKGMNHKGHEASRRKPRKTARPKRAVFIAAAGDFMPLLLSPAT